MADWLTGYYYRKKITVQTAYLDAALTDFPLYVPITADTDIGGRCRADGYDIRFTASDGVTLLYYERVSFAVAAGAATAIFWVKSSLTTSPATDIYIYYGKADAADGQDKVNTWTSYTRVWHLSEVYGTGAGNYKDSCGVGNLTLTDADADSAQGGGIVGKCVDLNGDADYLTDADHADHDPGGAMTVECWRKLDALASGAWYVGHDTSNVKWAISGGAGGTEKAYFYIRSASGLSICGPGTTSLLIGQWYHVVGVYNKILGANRLTLYINGLIDKQINGFNEDVSAGDEGLELARWSGGLKYLDGFIDEVRYSKDAKSAEWIKFVYYNITEADHELTWGAEEIGLVTYTISGSIFARSSISGSTKLIAEMTGQAQASSSIAGDVRLAARLAGSVQSASNITGGIKLVMRLAGPIAAASSLSATLTEIFSRLVAIIKTVEPRKRIVTVEPRKRIVTVDKRI